MLQNDLSSNNLPPIILTKTASPSLESSWFDAISYTRRLPQAQNEGKEIRGKDDFGGAGIYMYS